MTFINDMEEKHNSMPDGLKKETELDEETDYRGIAGSASLNAPKKEIKLDPSDDEEREQDNQNPLIRGI
ncbi:hypothetical protein QF042_001922 [Pedobacter sp. W3I1]|uniref:hypothetical protein n=1 Tax=Pedobacter sp. W3I1 TaxID=3042291 RepID=UPI00277FD06F|nr:hypothetical protein [Pedobacter sp. W3I1]MDQ0638357.1 hypothetical protein [Pedobacter sp. W3I1]